MTNPYGILLFVCCFSISGLCAQAPGGPEPERIKAGMAALHWNFFETTSLLGIDSIRNDLNHAGASGDDVIFQDFCTNLDSLQLDLSNLALLTKYVAKAEVYTHAQFCYGPDNSILFDAMGDKMLSKLSDTLERCMNSKRVDQDDPEMVYLVRKLADNRRFINVGVSNRIKTWNYLKEGRYGYVFHKLMTTYKTDFFLFLTALLAGVLLLFYRKRILKRMNQFFKKP